MKPTVTYRYRSITLLVVTVSLLSFGVVVAATPAVADHNTYENATVVDSGFTVELPGEFDHCPGTDPDDDADGHFLPSMQPFESRTNGTGLYLRDVEFHASWLDFSDCHGGGNFSAYGIDRSDSDVGTEYDDRLARYTKNVRFSASTVHVSFFELDDMAGDTPYFYPDDQLVLALADGSTGGACISVTEDPGWYRLGFFARGAAHNDSGDLPGVHDIDHGDRVALTQQSTYVYVCECEDSTEARQRLGPPPDRPEPTPTATSTPAPQLSPTPTSTSEPSPTATTESTPTGERPPGDSTATDPAPSDGEQTPTDRDGVGFTSTIGLLALLASIRLIYHRQ